MDGSTLVAILKTLNKKECRDFNKWLVSPFFNQRQDVIDLFQYLAQPKHLEQKKFLEKERIYRKIFPGATFDDARFRQVVHFLYKQLEQFLAYEEIDRNKYAFPIAFLKSMRKRKVNRAFMKKFKVLKKQGLGSPQLDSRGLKYSFDLFDEYSSLLVGIDRTKNIHLQDSITAFDTLFIAEKLKHACLALSHEQVFKTKYESHFLEEAIKAVENTPNLLSYPAVAVYYYGYLVQRKDEKSDVHYFSLRDSLLQFGQVFSESEQRDIYLMALNYCIQRMNKGATAFVREAFEIYREVIESKIIMESGVLSRWTYLNAALIALRLQEFEWVDHLLENYTAYLNPKHRDTFRSFCKAKLAFEQKNYRLAMELLIHFDSNDVLVSLNARTMLIKIYYEQDELDALDSLLDSTRIYLKRKEDLGYQKTVFENIVRYTKKLVRLNPYDKKKRQNLRAEIEAANPLTERPWLLAQIDKME